MRVERRRMDTVEAEPRRAGKSGNWASWAGPQTSAREKMDAGRGPQRAISWPNSSGRGALTARAGCRRDGHRRRGMNVSRGQVQGRLEVQEHLFEFLAANQADNVMTDRGANDLRLHRRQALEGILNERSADGRESVPIVKGKRPQFLTLVANPAGFLESHLPGHRFFPKPARFLETLGIVERVHFLRL